MNFLGIGPLELLLVLVLAFLVLGPTRMADTARKVGRFAKDLGRMTQGLPQTLDELVEAPEQQERPATTAPKQQPAPSAGPTPWKPPGAERTDDRAEGAGPAPSASSGQALSQPKGQGPAGGA